MFKLHSNYQDFNLAKWLEYIQLQHSRSIDLTLDRVIQVWQNLGSPVAPYNIVVAGTNGKGSSISLLDSIFRTAGKSVGAYTSPHLVRFNERIRVNGTDSTDDEICRAFCEIERCRDDVPLTYFEYGTLAALQIFSRRGVDMAILEVGMGGRLDAVNIVDSNIVLITSIGMDHEQWLGNSIESIATEKAGVIRKNGIVVFSDPHMPAAINSKCMEQNATLLTIQRDYRIDLEEGTVCWAGENPLFSEDWKRVDGMDLPFPGKHQLLNLGGAIAVAGATSSDTGVSPRHVKSGLKRPGLRGRLQVLSRSPTVIADVAHNHDSALMLSDFLADQQCSGTTFAVFGMLGDKSLMALVEPVAPHIQQWYLAGISGERGQSAAELGLKLENFCTQIDWSGWENPVAAYEAALGAANDEDRIVIFGSFHTVGDIIGHLEQG